MSIVGYFRPCWLCPNMADCAAKGCYAWSKDRQKERDADKQKRSHP